MTFVLFGQITMLGEVMAGLPSGAEQPLVDPTGRLVARPDDGEQPDPTELVSLAAGELTHPDDHGQVVFNSVGLQAFVTRTATRLGLLACSEAAGQWAGEVRFPWITDVLVRPRTGRRDPGGIRILFLDPTSPQPQSGRQFVDLVTTRQLPAGNLAWELVQRIVAHRHAALPPAAHNEHRQLESTVAPGQRPASAPAWYQLPYAAVDRAAVPEPAVSTEQTIRISAAEVAGPATVLSASPWAPPAVSAGPAAEPFAPAAGSFAPPAGSPAAPFAPATPGQMISAVPGVSRTSAADELVEPTARRRASAGTFRVELDSGEVLTIESPTLFGRDPAVDAGEHAVLQPISDATLSFSKTHLLLTPSSGGIAVTDRHSTNGVLVEHGGRLSACDPGAPTPLTLPATLRMGSRRMLVTQL